MRVWIVLLLSLIWLGGCSIAPITESATRTPAVRSAQLADGQSLFYRVAGQTHSTTTPILLVHGIPDASDSWNSIAAELGCTHPIYAVDLAGYGYSGRPDEYDVSLSAQANYLLELLDKLGLERVVIVGHDIGGGIAQIVAARQPQRIDRLVLINSVVEDNWPVLEMRLLRIPLLSYAALTLMEKPMWQHVLHKGFFNADLVTDEMLHRYQHWYQGSPGRQRLIRNAQALNNADLTSVTQAIRAVPAPTLILWGREDHYLDPALAQTLCQSLRRCQFVFVERAGHFVLDEQPQVVADAIEQFLLTK
jgi:2-hydroxymuconate-semialdehyde hydrolase